MSETTTQVEPWMTPEEARSWCDAAMSALPGHYLHRGDDIERTVDMLDAAPLERLRAAYDVEWESDNRVHFLIPKRILCFCAAILRAVKT